MCYNLYKETIMERWDKKGLPHKGWKYLYSEDFEDNYQTCEMCGQINIRYLHYLEHPEVDEIIGVGCECARKLCNEYVDFAQHEKDLRNKFNRKRNFLKQPWITKTSKNGKEYISLRYKGQTVCIIAGQYGKLGIAYPGHNAYDFSHNLKTLEQAKEKLFQIIDK